MNTKHNKNNTVRLFVALEIDDDTRGELEAAVETLAKCKAHVKWVPSSNMHLSLFFLGNTPREKLPGIEEALDAQARKTAPFRFSVSGIGTFGRKFPRVIWAGVECPPALMTLQENVNRSLEDLGFSPDRRKYKPHVTLGRVKTGRNKQSLLRGIEDLHHLAFGEVYTESCVLMESIPGSSGTRYEVVHRAKLSYMSECGIRQ